MKRRQIDLAPNADEGPVAGVDFDVRIAGIDDLDGNVAASVADRNGVDAPLFTAVRRLVKGDDAVVTASRRKNGGKTEKTAT